MSKTVYRFDSDGQLKPVKRLSDISDEDLMKYVESRQTRTSEDDPEDGGDVSFSFPEPPPVVIPKIDTFRVRVADVMEVFEAALGDHWDHYRIRRDFENKLEEHVLGWLGEKALIRLGENKHDAQ